MLIMEDKGDNLNLDELDKRLVERDETSKVVESTGVEEEIILIEEKISKKGTRKGKKSCSRKET